MSQQFAPSPSPQTASVGKRPAIKETSMSIASQPRSASSFTWKDVPTRSIDVAGAKFVYRQLGPDTGVPVIFLNHLAAGLDRWDPRVVDGIAARRRVIVFNNRGVASSEGSTPKTVAAMAHDAIRFIRALGHSQVDLFGFSLGGFVSQVIALEAPELARKIMLTGTGPAGGVGIDKVTEITIRDMIKAGLTFKHPEYHLFFTRTRNGRKAARDFLRRLNERTVNRDKSVGIPAFVNQLIAIQAWGRQAPDDLSRIRQPVLVANGDQDKMVPSSNSVDLARRLPNSELVLYEDAGHGGIFQHHGAFVKKALEFLESA
jgi:pimeloyl-ACP methyl ester carboxylesterase